MGVVVGINSPEAFEKVNHEPEPERVKFVAFMAKIAEQYLNGDIDVVMVGFVDPDGHPFPAIGDFPTGLMNDVLALGVSMEKETTKAVMDYYDADNAG